MTGITPTRIRTLPFTVSGIEQYTRRLLNIVLLKRSYKIIIYISTLRKKTEKSVYLKLLFTYLCYKKQKNLLNLKLPVGKKCSLN